MGGRANATIIARYPNKDNVKQLVAGSCRTKMLKPLCLMVGNRGHEK